VNQLTAILALLGVYKCRQADHANKQQAKQALQ
jgi:hypothetical protein